MTRTATSARPTQAANQALFYLIRFGNTLALEVDHHRGKLNRGVTMNYFA